MMQKGNRAYGCLAVLALVVTVVFFFQISVLDLFSGVSWVHGESLRHNSVCAEVLFDDVHVITMESTIGSRLNAMGGTGQWYHFAESLLPALHESAANLWKRQNRDKLLVIVFREEESLADLGPFGRFLCSLVLSGGSYGQIVFGYSKHIQVVKEKTSAIVGLDGFRRYFGVDLNSQRVDQLFIEDALHVQLPSQRHQLCLQEVAAITWNPFPTKAWISSPQNVTNIAQALERICPNVHARQISSPSMRQEYVAEYFRHQPVETALPPDDILLAIPRPWRKNTLNQTISHPIRHGSRNVTAGPKRNILFYQRDTYRKLLKESQARDYLSSVLVALDPRVADAWDVSTYVHSNEIAPCELIAKIRQADVLVTTHGFQSTLALFQPDNSLLVEVFPRGFYKPYVYGGLQAGFRAVGIPHSYLCEESKATGFSIMLLESVLGYSSHDCSGNVVCRFLAKNQNAHITKSLLVRIGKYIADYL